MRVLILFSNPADQSHLRLDKEHKVISNIAKMHKKDVTLETQLASDLEDFHTLISKSDYDIIQFSGHGNPEGIYLEKENYGDSGELVSAKRVVNLINLSNKMPTLVIFLCCYSYDNVSVLSEAAPFVITSMNEVSDSQCIEFVKGFYESYFKGDSIQASFSHAMNYLLAKQLSTENFKLNRRYLMIRNRELFIESYPINKKDSILINLEQVKDGIDDLGLDEAEFCHLIARKISIHYWIFDVPRDNVVIPIGKLLFGEFSWKNAKDVVNCTRLMKLNADLPSLHWEVWSKLLIAYNDLASCNYRSPNIPSDGRAPILKKALILFDSHIQRYLIPLSDKIIALGITEAVPNIEMVKSNFDAAKLNMKLKDYKKVFASLELALTYLHSIVLMLQPPEDKI